MDIKIIVALFAVCVIMVIGGYYIYVQYQTKQRQKKEIARLERKIEELNETIIELKEEHGNVLSNKESIIDDLNNVISDKESIIDELNGTISDKENAIQKLKNTLANVREESELNLSEKQKIIDDLKMEISVQDTQISQFQALNQSYNFKLFYDDIGVGTTLSNLTSGSYLHVSNDPELFKYKRGKIYDDYEMKLGVYMRDDVPYAEFSHDEFDGDIWVFRKGKIYNPQFGLYLTVENGVIILTEDEGTIFEVIKDRSKYDYRHQ